LRKLADRLLQMANSTAFNATGRVIIDLGVAINRLGPQKVYSVALGHAVAHIRQNESLRSIAPRLDELWSECVTVAHFSEAVAKRSSLPFPRAFAAGLLHGIGRFYILVQSASQGASQVPLNAALVDAWHPVIAKAVSLRQCRRKNCPGRNLLEIERHEAALRHGQKWVVSTHSRTAVAPAAPTG
jgi:hypothetical protein